MIYVDKTEHIYNLINSGRIYFLSRPRRFGKSLLISTFKELFKANKQIFEGLKIYDKWDWSKKYSVIHHLDFTEIQYATAEQLEISLDKFLDDTGKRENITLDQTATRLISVKFAELIEKLHKSTGQQVVVLIDEYDKPMIDNLVDRQVYDKVKRTLHNFYQVIKASDEHIKFMFMTGVSRFAGLSVFSAVHTNKGRIDVVLKKDNIVVIVEIKYSKDNKGENMLNEAMIQIKDTKYYEKYSNNNPPLLGIVFSKNKDIACRFENS